MNNDCMLVLNFCNIFFDTLDQLDGMLISREILLNGKTYEEVKKYIPALKKIMSSTVMTALHKNAVESQKWPLLNLVRQILHIYCFQMKPIRKSDGYTLNGIKKYKRFFQIKKNEKTEKTQQNKQNN